MRLPGGSSHHAANFVCIHTLANMHARVQGLYLAEGTRATTVNGGLAHGGGRRRVPCAAEEGREGARLAAKEARPAHVHYLCNSHQQNCMTLQCPHVPLHLAADVSTEF